MLLTNNLLPFPALVGLHPVQRALLLLAVEPGLAGVVVAAGVGTGKSTLVRSYARLLAGLPNGAAAPFVELPVGITEDRLLGGLDLELTLATGTRHHHSGVLARAHGGLLYADNVNLLEERTINQILAALDMGEVRIERDGLSLTEPANFALLATYDPAEGVPRQHLLDRVGLIVAPLSQSSVEQRMEVVRRHTRYVAQTDGALFTWEEEEQMLQGLIAAARELLPTVVIGDAYLARLSEAALALGVEGHRADIFATRAALAAAALAGRDTVAEDDLQEAIRMVLLPRATRVPEFAPEETQAEDQADQPPPPEPPPESSPDSEQAEDESNQDDPSAELPTVEELQSLEDLVLAALESDVPPDVLETPFSFQRRGRSGSRGSVAARRGRHVRSAPGSPSSGRIDIIATLRAAAPWQQLRQANGVPEANGTRPVLRVDDLHVKQFRNKAGTLFCFLVDASGSMAVHRMRQAKGAVNALLQQAYVHRDQVSLLAFRGDEASLLLPPSQSVELARRALDVLPTGGGTPLAAALLLAYQVAAQARSRGIYQTTLVLITDGKGNVPLHPDATLSRREQQQQTNAEIQQLAAQLQVAGVTAVVIDTQRSFLSRGEAQQLAVWLGGRYVYLPQGRGEEIARVVLREAEA